MSTSIIQPWGMIIHTINKACVLNMDKEKKIQNTVTIQTMHMEHIFCIMSSKLYFHGDTHLTTTQETQVKLTAAY